MWFAPVPTPRDEQNRDALQTWVSKDIKKEKDELSSQFSDCLVFQEPFRHNFEVHFQICNELL